MFTQRLNIKLLLVILLLFNFHVHYSQVISNPSFEGVPRQHIPPSGWTPCHKFSTPDTQPGQTNVNQVASHGNTYVGLVTRGNLGPYANTTEDVQTQLLFPLLTGNVYHMGMDLAHSKEFGHFIDWDSDFLPYDTPAKLRLFGGSTFCNKAELLWESPLIDHTEWKSYSITLQPQTGDIHYLIFEAVYAIDSTYFGNVLMDNISFDFCGFALPIETQSYDSLICERDTLVIDAFTPGGIYKWSTGSTEPSIMVTSPGPYGVEVSNGCEEQNFYYFITEKECNCEIALPNIFTPNGDGFNETFEIKGTSDIARFNLKIYNRWGLIVYQTNQISKPWRGEGFSSGIYYWTIDLMCINGNSIIDNSFRGWVTVQQ